MAEKIQNSDLHKPLLLGTKFTMEGSFYHDFMERYNIKITIPSKEDQNRLNTIIYEELGIGIINEHSKAFVLNMIEKYKSYSQIDSVILACTELPRLIKTESIDVPIFDTMELHINKAIEYILG